MKLPQRREVFGWVMHYTELAVGETIHATIPADIKPDEADNQTLWVIGEVRGETTDGRIQIQPRTPGRFSGDVGGLMLAGNYELWAETDSAWWCLSYTHNRRQRPQLRAFRLKAGEVAELPQGTLLFLGHGSLSAAHNELEAPTEIYVNSKAVAVTALTDCYGLFFDRVRA